MEYITKTRVKDASRLNFLPLFTGKYFMQYEQLIYRKLLEASQGQYDGGYWDYYTLSNGGFFMELDSQTRFNMQCIDNGYSGQMSAEAASLGVNLCIQNLFAWEINAQIYSKHYYQLRAYAIEHDEAAEILGFID